MKLKMFSSLGFGVLLSLISFSPVKAETKETSPVSSPQNSPELMISQLGGHNTYMGKPQLEWGDFLLGRVAGKSGDIMFIVLEDGTSFTASGTICPGSDVLVLKNADGRYSFVQSAESQWISILKSKYGYKMLGASSASLNQRTAALWKEMEASSSRTVEVPARQSTSVQTQQTQMVIEETEVIEYQETSQPIRGLW